MRKLERNEMPRRAFEALVLGIREGDPFGRLDALRATLPILELEAKPNPDGSFSVRV